MKLTIDEIMQIIAEINEIRIQILEHEFEMEYYHSDWGDRD